MKKSHNKYEMLALEERWGFWIKDIENYLDIDQSFKIFMENFEEDKKNDKIIKNFSYFTLQGNELIDQAHQTIFN